MKLSPSSSATGILLLAGLAAFSGSVRSDAQQVVVRPLSAAQVACDADQLRAVLARSALFFGPSYDDRTAVLLFTYGAPARDLSGLALMEQTDLQGHPTGPERQMTFSVRASQPHLGRNPAQPQLNTLYLLRDPMGSDLSLIEDPFAMAVVVDPTMDPAHNEDSNSLLVIDNIKAEEGGVPSDSKGGRGLMSILQRCPNNFTAADLHVFEILSRVVRAAVYTTKPSDPQARRMHKLATIYRGQEAIALPGGGVRATYRMDIYPVTAETLRRISLEMRIDMGNDGSLGNATMRMLPACASADAKGCSTSPASAVVSVIQPPSSDRVWSGSAPTVCWKSDDPACRTQVSFSFAERLQGTTWLKP